VKIGVVLTLSIYSYKGVVVKFCICVLNSGVVLRFFSEYISIMVMLSVFTIYSVIGCPD